jgi:hypothetical protein
MKTLRESLFDTDNVIKSDIKIGDLYEISPNRYYNQVHNNIKKFLQMFDAKKLDEADFPLKVREDCSFIEYWSAYNKSFIPFMNLIFNMPMVIADKLGGGYSATERARDYFKDYVSSHEAIRNLYIIGRKLNGNKFLEITIYDNIRDSSPNGIQITFERIK